MATIHFYLTDITYKLLNGKAAIYLFGKLKNGEQVCVIDDSFEPYFYVSLKDETALNTLTTLKIERGGEVFKVTGINSQIKKLLEKELPVYKIFTNIPKAVSVLKEELLTWNTIKNIYEADILFTRRYLIDKNLTPLTLIEAEGDYEESKLKIKSFKAKEIRAFSEEIISPKILSIDIETYSVIGAKVNPEEQPILMIALTGENLKKAVTWKKFETKEKDIEFASTEADTILRFKEILEDYKPDIITGYFTDGFDFPFIKTRAKKHKIKLDIGLDYSELTIAGKTMQVAEITGILHIDIFKFVRRIMAYNLNLDAYTLEAVASKILGEHKHKVDLNNLIKAWDNNEEKALEDYAKYNIHDAKLAYDLCEKLFPNIAELVKLINLNPADVVRMSFSQLVEWFLIKKAHENNELAPNRPGNKQQKERMYKSIRGALVFEPKPGLFENIAVFDYRSLYPTIIASHNISPGTLNCECCKNTEKVPFEEANYWFCKNKKGFMSEVIKNIISLRMSLKNQLKQGGKKQLLQARSDSLKILLNSFYGYLGFAQARWYCFECAESTTAYGRYYITKAMEMAKSSGFEILYSDTDSLFILVGKKTKENVGDYLNNVNEQLPGIMEMEYEGLYKSGIFVQTKTGEGGAKKKYALLDEKGDLKIKGFETVRRNWSVIAKEVQKEVLNIVLKELNPLAAINYIKKVTNDLKNNKIPVEKLVISTQLQKEIQNYESFGPHVAAAKRMKERGLEAVPGTMIKFIVAKGEGKIRDKVKLVDEVKQTDYDSEYYIKNQVIPSVERIFAVLNIDINKAVAQEGQKMLDSW